MTPEADISERDRAELRFLGYAVLVDEFDELKRQRAALIEAAREYRNHPREHCCGHDTCLALLAVDATLAAAGVEL